MITKNQFVKLTFFFARCNLVIIKKITWKYL